MKWDRKYIYTLTKELFAINSPTGFTGDAIDYLQTKAEEMGYKTFLTEKGNLIVEVEGVNNDTAVGVSAHTDTLGLMVRSIKSNGKLAITQLGGPQMNTLDGEYCTIITRENRRYTGTILSTSPSSHVYKDASTIARTADTMEIRIDEKVTNKEEVIALGIRNGDIIAIDTKTQITSSGFIKSRFLDDKISVVTLFTLLKHWADNGIKPQKKTYIIITTYEEVGHGCSWIPNDIKEMVAVDMGCIGTDLSCTEYDVSICAKDSTGPYDYQMTSRLIHLAEQNDIQHAIDIYPFYGSDIGAALQAGNDIKGALIGPGVHASHGMERTHIEGVEATLSLINLYLTK
ncbi:MAG: M42 family metallopeptidase [Erysipelotrichaceae bacterium]|nr:M42 family metallopeptidase [Erysipelotrichaceae bacterium]